jgi:cell wall-associated NlpC family hydrolase
VNLPQFIGIPYAVKGRSFAGCDCWGLLYLFYGLELGITLPEYALSFADAAELLEAQRVISAEKGSAWQRVEKPIVGDAVLINTRGDLTHIGVYVGGGFMLHTRCGMDSSLVRLDAPYWRKSLDGYYRHVG